MRKILFGFTVVAACAGLLWAGLAVAALGGEPGPPTGNPPQGGNNQCQADLAACQAAICSNGVAEFGEECDGANLQGATCASEGFLFGTVACSATCTVETSGCTDDRFVANGDGTITDNQTGLMWERKVPGGGGLGCVDSLHGVDTTCDWNTAMSEWLTRVNGLSGEVDGSDQFGLGGYSDWRLSSHAELQTILDLTAGNCGDGAGPCTTIPGETAGDFYWSATTDDGDTGEAWLVGFLTGNITPFTKGFNFAIRAVRAGP